MTFYAQMPSDLGTMLLCSNGSHLSGLYFIDQSDCPLPNAAALPPSRREGPSAGLMEGLPIKKFKAHRVAQGDLFASAPPAPEKSGIAVPGSGGVRQGAPDESLQDPFRVLQADTPDCVKALFQQARHEIDAYFRCELKSFTVPLHVEGTEFQKKVWRALLDIPYGESASYGDVASSAGLGPQHGRPVGTAVGRNPISIIIPCHRVLGGGGTLTGYTGGLARKVSLLQLEGFTLG